ncbi:MAG: carboxypeptidase regulatory-like domain-containing protein [bacterium]|nr:MAG: carboxypeptidase regulatory-like domain-containing protein [bacterium]
MKPWTFNRRLLRQATPWMTLAAVVLLLTGGCGSADRQTPAPVTGTVSVPLAEARVYIYQEDDDIYGPARVISEPTSQGGGFTLSLRPGRYVAVVRKRASGEAAGPVMIGDYRSEPLAFEVREGQESVSLSLTATLKLSGEKDFPPRAAEQTTAITGTILDAEGRPVEGVRVHVYDHIQMSERPKYVSERTGADGRFFVPVRRGGTYYLAARDRFGGPPQLGDLFGRYDEGTVDPSGIVVRKGEVTEGITITVHKVW